MSFLDNLVKSLRLGSQPLSQHEIPMEDLNKSQRAAEGKAIVEDPLALVSSLGFKDKPYSLSFDTLKKMASRNSVISSIISTRVNQVSTFTQPARFTHDGVGYEIKLRDPKAVPNEEDKAVMLALEEFLENCGYNYDAGRDTFDTFVRKVLRDSLIFDQLCFEVVPDRMGRPAEFHAVDASTIRAAISDIEGDEQVTTTYREKDDVQFVQVIGGSPVNEFSGSEMAFAVRNPRSDINIQPYGLSELEILVQQVTAHLWAEEYNSKYFSQGGTTKGVLNLKGQNISKDQLDAFRRQWTAQVSGMTGAWKTPVVSVDGLEYINVSQSNREMEYEMWMNYLINICCAVYQIDPAEINFPNRGGSGGSNGGLGEGGIEDRLKGSKDKGLRPLLRFVESTINRYIIRRFSNKYHFNFVGLDKESETEKLEVTNKEVRAYKTVNEVRKEKDMDPLDDGDVILDPTYINYVMQKQGQEQAEQAQQEQPQEGGDNPDDPNAQPTDDPQQDDQDVQDSQVEDSLGQRYGQ